MSDSEQPADHEHGSIHSGNQQNVNNNNNNQNNKPIRKPTKASDAPSFIVQTVRSVFGFRKTSLTLFVLLTYAVVFILVNWARQNSLSLPSKEPSILSSSWTDLQVI